nr:hypothetical protein [Tanacetum cinerariifolium]
LEPKSDKESPKVEITTEVQLVNINDEEEESAEDDYELKQREKGKHVEESRSTPSPITIRSSRTHTTLISSNTKKLQEFMETDLRPSSSTSSSFLSKSNIMLQTDSYHCINPSQDTSSHILHVHLTQATPTYVQEQQQQLYLTMRDSPQLQHDALPIWLALKYKFERLHVATTPCRPSAIHPKDQVDPHDDCNTPKITTQRNTTWGATS